MGKNHKKERKFLNLPTYPGGGKALVKFLIENQKYPDEAAKNKIEGLVYIGFDVDHMGRVSSPKVIHGLGFGCDEEAIRLVKLLKYNSSYNRGVRVKKRMRLKIPFTLRPEKLSLMYSYIENQESDAEPGKENEERKDNDTYGYTIKF